MKILLAALLFGVITGGVSPGQSGSAGSPKQPFAVAISAVNPSVKSNDPIEIKIRLANGSNYPITASGTWDRGLDISYDYDIRDSAGRPPELKKREGPITGAARISTLDPGKAAEEVLDLSRWYDMRAPGKYTIQVSRNIRDTRNHEVGIVTSNKITITVVP